MLKKVLLFVCFLLIPAFGVGVLFADDLIQNEIILSVEFAADDFETLRLFNEKGSLITDPELVSGIQTGWIIQTENSGVELYAEGVGTLYLSPSTLISVDLISADKAEFFLLKGKLRFISESDRFPVYIITPAAQYTINTPGEYILLSENTENFYVLAGKADVFNRITQKSSTIEEAVAYESLNRREPEKSFVEGTTELLQETLQLQVFNAPESVIAIPEPSEEPEEELVAEEIELEPEPEPVIIAAFFDEGFTIDEPDEIVLIPVVIEEVPAVIDLEPIIEAETEEAIVIDLEPIIETETEEAIVIDLEPIIEAETEEAIAVDLEPIIEAEIEEAIAVDIIVEEPLVITTEEELETPIELEPVIVIALPSITEVIPEEPIEIAEEELEPIVFETAATEPEPLVEPEFAPVIIDLLIPEPESEPVILEAATEEPLVEAVPETIPLEVAEIVPIIVPDNIPGSIDSYMSAPVPQLEEILRPEDEIIEVEFTEPITIIAEAEIEEVLTEPIDIQPVEAELETVVVEPIIIAEEASPEPTPETTEVPEIAEVLEELTPEAEIEIIVDEPTVIAISIPETTEEPEAISPELEVVAVIQADTETIVKTEIIVDEPVVIAETVPESTEKPDQPLIVMAEPSPIVTASYESDTDNDLMENILITGIILETSSVHTDQSTEYENSYLHAVAAPWINYNNFSIGLYIPLMFDDYPLSIANWYLPRGNNPYDFGTGYSSLASFEAIRDLSLDILSLIGYVNYRSSTGSFKLNADDHTTLSMGTGALISGLNPMIDDPFIRRVGFQNTLTTPYFDYELLINDLTHAELFGLRLAAKPMGQSFPMEIGLYAISDISLSPNKFVIVPGIDITVPIAYREAVSLNVYADFSLLMLSDSSGFNTDTLFTDGYLAVVGARGKSRAFSFGLSGSYQNAMLTQGMFGTDYAWRRAGLITEFFDDTAYTDGGHWAVSAEIGYDWGMFDAQMSYRFNFDENFAVSSWDEDRDEISFSAAFETEPLTVEFGLRKRGFASVFSPSGPSTLQEFLFDEQTQLFAGASYTNGSVTVNAELSGSAQYQAPESSAALNNIDNQLLDSEENLIISPTLTIGTKISISNAKQDNTLETAAIENKKSSAEVSSNFGFNISSSFFHPFFDQLTGVYDGPYTQFVLSPYYTSDNFSFGLNAAVAFNSNPLSIANWYLPRGNNPYNFGTGYSSLASFEAIRDLSLDILSLIGYANYRSSTGSFTLNADDHTTLSMGTGALISGLNPMIDDPFIRRVGFQNTLTTPYFDYELLINDLTHAELFGLRLAAKPMGQSFPMEIGLYAISDISISPNKFVIVPGIDITAPLSNNESLSLTVYTDFSLLMLADNTGFHTESFFSEGSLYNYLAVLGARGKTGDFSFALSGAYQNALLTQGLFGTDYSWRRAGLIEALFDDADYSLGKDLSGSWSVTAEIGYDWGIFDAQMSYRFNLDENFAVSSWDEDRDEISFSAAFETEPLNVEFGLRNRGFASAFSPSGPSTLQEFLFDEQTQLFAGASYTNGSVTVNAELSGSAQYKDTESSTGMNNLDEFESSSGSLIISPTLSFGTKIKLY